LNQIRIALLSIHSCPWANPGNRYTGGMNIYIQNIARKLADLGHLVDIYTCSHPREKCGSAELAPGIRLIHVTTENDALLSSQNLQLNIDAIADSIISYSIQHNISYKLIHSHYWLSGLVGNIVAKAWSIPHVTMFHTLATLKNSAGIGFLEPESRILLEQEVVGQSDLIIASTQKEKNELISKYFSHPEKIKIIPCGIDQNLFRPLNRYIARKEVNLGTEKIILFVGRMDPLKGLTNLLEAISMLMPRNDFQLLIIGGEDQHKIESADLVNFINDLKINQVVSSIGSIKHQDMHLYYNAADFCVIPSFYESFSMVALEALACGIPILSTDVGEVKDMLSIIKTGKILGDNAPESIATGINEMLINAANNHTGNVEKLHEMYGWDRITGRLLDEYSSLFISEKLLVQPALNY
jgi:D-inositol-3-phosphate glycosyltransferase